MDTEGHSLSALRRSLEEIEKDMDTFVRAFDLINKRSQEAGEVGWQFSSWMGTFGVLGSLETGMECMRGSKARLQALIKKVEDGEVPDTDRKARLAVLDGGKC